MSLRCLVFAAALLGTAACVPRTPAPAPSPPVGPPAARPAPAPSPMPAYTSWMDVPRTPGDWRFAPIASGSEARYGEAASEARFIIRCVRADRSVELIRLGTFAGGAAIIVRSESASRSLAGAPTTNSAGLRAALSASDPLLDAMAFSKGRFAIETPGVPPLYLPSWPEVTRVIEDCR